MKIIIDIETYKGFPGSSLSDFRCEQTIALYDFVYKNPGLNYVQVQKETVDLKLFKSHSVLRTFCPLLANLHFVEYGDDKGFIFTEDGVLFVKTIKALELCKQIKNKTEQDNRILNQLLEIKRKIIRLGITNMFNDPELHDNNLWLVLDLLANLDYLKWNEYFIGLYLLKQNNCNINDVCKTIIENRQIDETYEPINPKGEKIADTQWSYIRSLLYEADLIEDYNEGSKLNSNGRNFFKEIIYGKY